MTDTDDLGADLIRSMVAAIDEPSVATRMVSIMSCSPDHPQAGI